MRADYPPPPPNTRQSRFSLPKLLLAVLLLAGLPAAAQAPMQCSVVGSPVPAGPIPKAAASATSAASVTSCTDIQNIRVNVHFLQHDDGTGNFGPFDDGRPGTPGTNDTGYSYAQALIGACNGHMDQNPPLRLAPGNTLTPIRKRIRWVLEGVYFDRSSTYRNGAGTQNSPFHDYTSLCVRADSVINIFLVEEAQWPYVGPLGNNNINQPSVASPLAHRGYVFASNQANCNSSAAPGQLWAVVASPWTNYILFNKGAWEMASTVNHELCHLLGLNHPHQYNSFTWGECAEAPMNANCWNVNEPATPACSSISQVSNNLMDYNSSQGSLAPCQIGIMQDNLNSCLAGRYVYKCSDCLPVTATFDLAALPVPGQCMPAIWLDSRAAANYNWYTLEIDRTLAGGIRDPDAHYESTVFGNPLGRVQLNALYSFKASSTYYVKWTTHAYCGTAAVQFRTIQTPVCARGDARPQPATVSTTIPSPRP